MKRKEVGKSSLAPLHVFQENCVRKLPEGNFRKWERRRWRKDFLAVWELCKKRRRKGNDLAVGLVAISQRFGSVLLRRLFATRALSNFTSFCIVASSEHLLVGNYIFFMIKLYFLSSMWLESTTEKFQGPERLTETFRTPVSNTIQFFFLDRVFCKSNLELCWDGWKNNETLSKLQPLDKSLSLSPFVFTFYCLCSFYQLFWWNKAAASMT